MLCFFLFILLELPLDIGKSTESVPYVSLLLLLMKYNSCIIKHTLLKSIICLVYPQSCATITTVSFQNIFITLKKIMYSLAVTSHSLLPQPLETTNLPSISMCLLALDNSYNQNCIISGFLLSSSFYLVYFQGSSMLEFESVLHYFLWQNNILLYGYTIFCLFII